MQSLLLLLTSVKDDKDFMFKLLYLHYVSQQFPFEVEMTSPSMPKKETAWERGLKKAKEAS